MFLDTVLNCTGRCIAARRVALDAEGLPLSWLLATFLGARTDHLLPAMQLMRLGDQRASHMVDATVLTEAAFEAGESHLH
jgi:hypothetical protein